MKSSVLTSVAPSGTDRLPCYEDELHEALSRRPKMVVRQLKIASQWKGMQAVDRNRNFAPCCMADQQLYCKAQLQQVAAHRKATLLKLWLWHMVGLLQLIACHRLEASAGQMVRLLQVTGL